MELGTQSLMYIGKVWLAQIEKKTPFFESTGPEEDAGNSRWKYGSWFVHKENFL